MAHFHLWSPGLHRWRIQGASREDHSGVVPWTVFCFHAKTTTPQNRRRVHFVVDPDVVAKCPACAIGSHPEAARQCDVHKASPPGTLSQPTDCSMRLIDLDRQSDDKQRSSYVRLRLMMTTSSDLTRLIPTWHLSDDVAAVCETRRGTSWEPALTLYLALIHVLVSLRNNLLPQQTSCALIAEDVFIRAAGPQYGVKCV